MEETKNFSKVFKLHEACSKEDISKNLNYVWFKDGYAYVSNSHIAVKAKIEDISDFEEEDIAILNGKAIHANSYRELLKYKSVSVKEDGFHTYNKFGKEVICRFAELEGIKMPNIDQVLTDSLNNLENATFTPAFGLCGVNFTKLVKAMGRADYEGFSKVRIDIAAGNKAIVVRPIQSDEKHMIGLIMPCIFD